MLCPTCKTELSRIKLKRTEIDRCPSCSGIWLDKGELDALVDKKNEAVEFDTVDHDSGFHGDTYPRRNCPKCEKIMKKVDFKTDTPIIYDYCPGCLGFWLDKKELEQTKNLLRRLKEQNSVFDNIFLFYMSKNMQEPNFF